MGTETAFLKSLFVCLFVLNKGKEQWLRVDALYPAEIGCISYRTLWCDLAKLGWIEFLTINDMTVQIICLCFSWLRTLWFWGFNHMQGETPKPLRKWRTGKNQSQDPTGHMPLSFSLSDLIPFLTPVWGYIGQLSIPIMQSWDNYKEKQRLLALEVPVCDQGAIIALDVWSDGMS